MHHGDAERIGIAQITATGQLSLPAPVRRRWGTSRVAITDGGDHVVVRPLPDDPINAAGGSLAGRGGPSEGVRARERRAERKAGREVAVSG